MQRLYSCHCGCTSRYDDSQSGWELQCPGCGTLFIAPIEPPSHFEISDEPLKVTIDPTRLTGHPGTDSSKAVAKGCWFGLGIGMGCIGPAVILVVGLITAVVLWPLFRRASGRPYPGSVMRIVLPADMVCSWHNGRDGTEYPLAFDSLEAAQIAKRAHEVGDQFSTFEDMQSDLGFRLKHPWPMWRVTPSDQVRVLSVDGEFCRVRLLEGVTWRWQLDTGWVHQSELAR